MEESRKSPLAVLQKNNPECEVPQQVECVLDRYEGQIGSSRKSPSEKGCAVVRCSCKMEKVRKMIVQ
jgi:hypothetical protein